MSPSLTVATVDQDAIINAMPATARDLVSAIGFLPTLDLLQKFGGKRLFVPSKLTEESKLIAALGRDVAEALVKRMGGSQLEPPMMSSVERLLRDNAIRADFDAGATVPELVDRYRLTQRHLRKVLKASPDASPARRPERARDPYTRDMFQHQRAGAAA
jgi:hypothetical protein